MKSFLLAFRFNTQNCLSNMGTINSIPEYQLDDLLSSTNFNKEELNQHYKKFMNITTEGELNKQQFDEICTSIFTTKPPETISKKLFNSFDLNKDGFVSFRELMTSLSLIMKGTNEEKLKWLFRIYDLDDDGRITMDEVFDVVESMHTTAEGNVMGMGCAQVALRTAEIEHMFRMVDKDSNGYWSVEEFVSSMQKHPAFLKMLKLVDNK